MKTNKIHNLSPFIKVMILTVLISIYSTLFANQKNVLILNSYHQGQLWSDNIMKGIYSTLKSSDLKIDIHTEYMDTKRYSPDIAFKYIEKLYISKYKNRKFDLIIATDNNALDFTLLQKDKLFKDTPVVFCGINNFKKEMLGDKTNITGIAENINIKNTVDFAKTLNPDLKKLLIINDTTNTGKALKKKVNNELLKKDDIDLEFEYIDDIEYKTLIKKINKLPKDNGILLLTFHKDKNNKWFSIEEFLSLITLNSSVPVFSMWGHYMDKGIIGGVLVDGQTHGILSAQYAIRILKGESVNSIPISSKSLNIKMADYKQLEKFNIPLKNLPNDTKLINKKISKFEEYKLEIVTTLAIITILIISLVILIIYNRKLERYKEKEIQLENIVENLPGFSYRCVNNKNWDMLHISQGIKKLCGYDSSDLINSKLLSYSDIIDPADKKYVWEYIQKQLSTSKSFELEYRIITKNGEKRWIWEQGARIKNNNSNIEYLEGIILDIDAKKKIEQQLVTSEHRYRNLFEHAEVAIWNEDFSNVIKEIEKLKKTGIDDPHSYFQKNKHIAIEILKSIKLIHVNKATLSMFNASSEQELFNNLDKTFTDTALDIFIKELCAIWDKKEFFYEETTFKTIDGKELSAIISFKIPKDNKGFESIPVSMIETTPLKKIQKDLDINTAHIKTLVNTIPDLIWLKDKDGVYLGCNHKFEQFFGAKESEILGKTDYDFVDKELADFFKEHDNKALKAKKPLINEEEVIFANDGHKELLETVKTPMYDLEGNLIGVLGVARDITERKKAEQKLIEKEEIMLMQSRHAAMGEMISMIAHQWRQPLSVISMNSNNILADIDLEILDEDILKDNALNTIHQTNELSKTIDDFKNFFRPTKTAEEVFIKDIFDEAIKVVGKSIEYHRITLSTDFKNDKKIKTYSRELMQVIINIIKNAKETIVERGLKDTKEQEHFIDITVDHNENKANIKICDSGGGIPNDILDKIFEPYFSTKDEQSGTGLGLYMSKTIIEKHLKGTIKAYNHPKGACFDITISDLSS